MSDQSMYHEGMRALQDSRETRPLAERLEQVTLRTEFTPEDRAFIESRCMFFVATADAQGHPDCSYKGGLPGFVRVIDERTLAFPDYDGNGISIVGQRAGQSRRGPAVPGLREAETPSGQRLGANRRGRSAAQGLPRRRLHRSRYRRQDLPELPSVHPQDAARRVFDLCSASRLRSAGPCLEDVRHLPGRLAGARPQGPMSRWTAWPNLTTAASSGPVDPGCGVPSTCPRRNAPTATRNWRERRARR